MHFVRAQVFGSKKLSTSFSIFAPQAETDFSCHGRAGGINLGSPQWRLHKTLRSRGIMGSDLSSDGMGRFLAQWVANP